MIESVPTTGGGTATVVGGGATVVAVVVLTATEVVGPTVVRGTVEGSSETDLVATDEVEDGPAAVWWRSETAHTTTPTITASTMTAGGHADLKAWLRRR